MSIFSFLVHHLARILLTALLTTQLVQIDGTDGNPCIPIEGKTALFIGQDYYSIRNYTEVLGGNLLGLMSYTCEYGFLSLS